MEPHLYLISQLSEEADNLSDDRSTNRAENIERAIQLYNRALNLAKSIGLDREWAAIQTNLGAIYGERILVQRASNIEKAIQCYELALEVFNPQDFPSEWASTQHNLGNAYMNRSYGSWFFNVRDAIEHYSNAIKIIKKENSPDEWDRTQFSLGEARCIAGDFEQGIQCLQELLSFSAQSRNSILIAKCLETIGFAYCQKKTGEKRENIEQGIAHIEKALEIYLSSGESIKWAYAQFKLAQAYANRLVGDSIKNLSTAIACCRLSGKDLRESDKLTALKVFRFGGELAFKAKQFEETYMLYQQAVAILEELWTEISSVVERINVLRENSIIFEHLIFCSIELGKYDQAVNFAMWQEIGHMPDILCRDDTLPLGVSDQEWKIYRQLLFKFQAMDWEMHRATSFLKVIGVGVERDKNLWEASEDRISTGSSDTSRMRCELFKHQEELSSFEAEIRSRFPEWSPKAKPFVLEDLINIAKMNHALIVVLRVTEQGTYAFFLAESTTSLVTDDIIFLRDFCIDDLFQKILTGWFLSYHYSGSAKEALQFGKGIYGPIIKVKVEATDSPDKFAYSNFKTANFRDWQDKLDNGLSNLYEYILKPVHEKLQSLNPKPTRVIFLVNKGLQALPLHAAYLVADGKRHYILDDFDIVTMPSAAMLKYCVEKDNSEHTIKNLFAVQNPTGDLPFADWEVEYVRDIFSPQKSLIFAGSQAMKEAVLNNITQGDVILMSCHSSFDLNHPMKSSIRLYGDTDLKFEDIIGLDLSLNWLITLSACETCLSDPTDIFDEQLGIYTAFLLAGAHTVVASLWKVNDVSTMLLMTKFYEHISESNSYPDKAHALRMAQIWLRDCTMQEVENKLTEIKDKLVAKDHAKPSFILNSFAKVLSSLRDMDESCGGYPFSHPYWWSAFQCLGAAWAVKEDKISICGDNKEKKQEDILKPHNRKAERTIVKGDASLINQQILSKLLHNLRDNNEAVAEIVRFIRSEKFYEFSIDARSKLLIELYEKESTLFFSKGAKEWFKPFLDQTKKEIANPGMYAPCGHSKYRMEKEWLLGYYYGCNSMDIYYAECVAQIITEEVVDNFGEYPENIRNLLIKISEEPLGTEGVARALSYRIMDLPTKIRDELLVNISEEPWIGWYGVSNIAYDIKGCFDILPEDIRNKLLLRLLEYDSIEGCDACDLGEDIKKWLASFRPR